MKNRNDYSEYLNSEWYFICMEFKEVMEMIGKEEGYIVPVPYHWGCKKIMRLCESLYSFGEKASKDEDVNKSAKERAPRFFEKEDAQLCMQMCRDLANLGKHRVLNEGANDSGIHWLETGSIFTVSMSKLDYAFENNVTHHALDSDEEYCGDYIVVFKGNEYNMRDVLQDCYVIWSNYLEDNQLLIPNFSSHAT